MNAFDISEWCRIVGSTGADVVYDEVMSAPGLEGSIALFDEGQDHLVGKALSRLRELHGINDQTELDQAGDAILEAFVQRVDMRIRTRRRASIVVAFNGGAA